MIIKILGSAGSSPSNIRACSSYIIDGKYLLDAGPSSYRNLITANMDPNNIESIFITHLHGDHIFDLGTFIWGMATWERSKLLEIFGPPGIENFVSDLLKEANTPKTFVNFEILARDINAGDLPKNDIKTTAGYHTIYDLAYRINDLCYTGDTKPSENIVELADGCELLIHESSFIGGMEDLANSFGHSTASQAADIAKRSNSKRLLLTHISPIQEKNEFKMINDALSRFSGEVMIAEDLMEIRI